MASQFLCTSKSVERLRGSRYQPRSRVSEATYYAGNNNTFMTVDITRTSHSNGVTSFRNQSHPLLRSESFSFSDDKPSTFDFSVFVSLSPLVLAETDDGKVTLESAM